jgi:hypothetical protein
MSRLTLLIVVVALGVACAQGGTPPPAAGNEGAGLQAAGSESGARNGDAARATESPAAAAVGTAEAPKPQFKEITIPSGTSLSLTLESGVASDTSKVEDTVRAKVAKPIVIDGVEAVPAGAEVVGSVTSAEQSGRVKGRASVAFRFHRLTAWDEAHEITTARIAREAKDTKGSDAKKIGIGAGAGALVGAIAGGGKGAAIGAAVGGGAGTGVVMATRGEEVRLPAGTPVRTTLEAALTVRAPLNRD